MNYNKVTAAYYEYYPDKQNIFDFGIKGKKNTNLLKHKYETSNGGLSLVEQ
jgi:hypothetical protein